MNKYEMVVIVDAQGSLEEKEGVLKETCDPVAKCSGKVINNQVWLDKHRFSFRIKKKQEGTYYLINFELPGSEVVNIRRSLRLNEKVLRSLIIKVG